MAKKKSKHKPHKMHAKNGSKYHSNLAGKHKKPKRKKASKKRDSVASHMQASARRGVSYGEKVTLHGLQAKVKRTRGKRWTCGGPVRSGCGGSSSRVIGKVH